jgi:sporadic carbohydrate cluster protein (TIGR04323 family)
MNLKGYIFSRSFREERVPQHVQNIVLKDYCLKNNLKLLLSATEYTYENNYYILRQLLSELKNYDGILFYSLFQLPKEEEFRKKIYNKIIKSKKSLYFAVENAFIKEKIDIKRIEEIILLKDSQSQEMGSILLGKERKFITEFHKKTKRNYKERMMNNKIECMKVAKKYGFDYWDGSRKFGYGGYKYIKDYWKPLAYKLIKSYNLNSNSKILDIGCGKGFLLYEIKKIIPGIKIRGFDISRYAISKSQKLIAKDLSVHDARKRLKFKNNEFDLVFSFACFHNFLINELFLAIQEMERVGKKKLLMVESYRNEKELFNLQCWALTAQSFHSKEEWKWIYNKIGYSGDYEFIYFE